MKIVDISQEVFSCSVYPGDPVPQREILSSMADGDLYNLTAFRMCAHNGTHIDAPLHFIDTGMSVDQLPLEPFVGPACVLACGSELTAEDAQTILEKARSAGAAERILLKGDGEVSSAAARVFAAAGILLLGVEGPSVGPVNAPMEVHRILLEAGTVLLEGIRLDAVQEGLYFLSAAPINLGGTDGAPCRAILMEMP